jgi:hypothetical protein
MAAANARRLVRIGQRHVRLARVGHRPAPGAATSDERHARPDYLCDVLERIVSGRIKNHQLHELLAWNWKAAREAAGQVAA